jgi:hypothetical protein
MRLVERNRLANDGCLNRVGNQMGIVVTEIVGRHVHIGTTRHVWVFYIAIFFLWTLVFT